MKLTNPDLQSRLAAEYVLGTLRGGARRRFEDYLRRLPALRDAVHQWEQRLVPMAARLKAITPRDRVWKQIEARIASGRAPVKATSMWDSLAFWRTLGFSASGVAIALLTATLAFKTADPSPMLTAVLAEDNNEARAFIEQPKSGMLMVKMVKPWKTLNGMNLQLWVVPKNGAPRSLGIINETGETKLVIVSLDEQLVGGMVFALSKEPPGGSPTGQPTPGMVMCKGAIAHMPSKKPLPPI